MMFLTFMAVIFAVYVASFKDDFNKESLDKLVPVTVALLLLVVVLGTVFSLLGVIS